MTQHEALAILRAHADDIRRQGVTALYLLAESHLACHTYPESQLATFNLYCCRERAAVDWPALLAEALGAARVQVTTVARGGA